jgi:hypothetical protein
VWFILGDGLDPACFMFLASSQRKKLKRQLFHAVFEKPEAQKKNLSLYGKLKAYDLQAFCNFFSLGI